MTALRDTLVLMIPLDVKDMPAEDLIRMAGEAARESAEDEVKRKLNQTGQTEIELLQAAVARRDRENAKIAAQNVRLDALLRSVHNAVFLTGDPTTRGVVGKLIDDSDLL